LKYAVVSLYSVVKQQLKCNTSKVCNCLVFTHYGSFIEEGVFLVEYVFQEGNRYTDLVQEQEDFYLWGAAKCAVYHDRPHMLNPLNAKLIPICHLLALLGANPILHVSRMRVNELKTAITAYIRSTSQADLQEVFANKIKRVQACINARGHHFQHLL
jgi:hypothetical protein